MAQLAPEDELLGAGDRIGPYRLLRLLGEGGFGTVYLAEQTEPLQRLVAVKLIRGVRDRRLLRRFEVEEARSGASSPDPAPPVGFSGPQLAETVLAEL